MTTNSAEVRPTSLTLPSQTLWPNVHHKRNFGPSLTMIMILTGGNN